jgi:hypothetical protein
VGHYTAGGGGEDENIDVQQAALWNRNYFFTIPVLTFEKL